MWLAGTKYHPVRCQKGISSRAKSSNGWHGNLAIEIVRTERASWSVDSIAATNILITVILAGQTLSPWNKKALLAQDFICLTSPFGTTPTFRLHTPIFHPGFSRDENTKALHTAGRTSLYRTSTGWEYHVSKPRPVCQLKNLTVPNPHRVETSQNQTSIGPCSEVFCTANFRAGSGNEHVRRSCVIAGHVQIDEPAMATCRSAGHICSSVTCKRSPSRSPRW